MLNKICNEMANLYCEGCDLMKECRKDYNYNCGTRAIMNEIRNLEITTVNNEEGCFICNSGKDIFFEDGRGGFRIAEFCPNCGKKLN